MEVGDERVGKQVTRLNLYLQFPLAPFERSSSIRMFSVMKASNSLMKQATTVAQETFCLNPAVGGCGPDLRWKNLRLICILPRYITDDLVRKRMSRSIHMYFFVQ